MGNTVLKDFNEMLARLEAGGERKCVAVACPDDESSITALCEALDRGLINARLVCYKPLDERLTRYEGHVQTYTVGNDVEAAAKAVELVRQGEADILMKGLISSDTLLHAILNRETGILPRGRVLTHMAVAHMPVYPRLIAYTDAAVIPYPSQEQRETQVGYMVDLCHSLHISCPRVSLIHCSEHVNEKYFPFTLGYQQIKDKAAAGDFGSCIVDGPLDVKTSLSQESLQTKGISSPIAGQADVLVFPDIEAANTFHKTITLFCQAEIACLLQGPDAPVVMPSRSDSGRTKLLSIAMACYVLLNKKGKQ